jgi:Taurine catabolism dioxygenase TauD, TfdA family
MNETIGVVPTRTHVQDVTVARRRLAKDGAVILSGLEPTPDALVVAAAHLLGDRLRQLFPLRERTSSEADPVHLHGDSFDVQVDIGGVTHRRRDPDEDYLLIQCVQPSPTGGESFVADAYRFADHCAATDPALWEFLTQYDVDLYGAWAGLRGLPATPTVARHIEYTRTGRRIIRRAEGAVPLHRDPRAGHIRAMLVHYERSVHALEPELPRFALAPGDILALDNYRCWHGRDAHPGDRLVRILTLRTDTAR